MFTKLLAERLDTRSALTVREGEAGGKVVPGSVWVAPGGSHMVLERSGPEVLLRLNQEPAENSCRPAVDPLFRSVVAIYGRQVLAVIMTGMGKDGYRGCEKVREMGGQILAQDEASSVVWGMPGLVAKAGLADAVLPLKDLAAEIVRRVARPDVASSSRPGFWG
jgi:two-component system chemotaxis response regulator CheB